MLKLVATFFFIGTVINQGFSQNTVRVSQTNYGTQTREINNTVVPVIEKKENNAQKIAPAKRYDKKPIIRPATNSRQGVKPKDRK